MRHVRGDEDEDEDEEGEDEHAATVGAYLQEQFQRFGDHPLVGEVRGVGLIAGIELVADKASKQPFESGAVGAAAQKACQDAGLIVRALGGAIHPLGAGLVALCASLGMGSAARVVAAE